MAIGGKGPPTKPGPSLKGSIVVDTVRGVPRVRPWPKSKPATPGTPRSRSIHYFTAANRICKAWHPRWGAYAWELTRGTPYLPRDPLLMAMFGRLFAVSMPDGKQWWSMANRNDVSKSLDVLGTTESFILKRGPDFWEAVPAPAGAGVATLVRRTTNLDNQNLSALTPVPMQTAVYDDGQMWAISPNPHLLTLPAGYTRVRITAGLGISGLSTRAEARLVGTGSLASMPVPSQLIPNAAGFAIMALTSPWFPYAPGDTVALYAYTPTDTLTNILALHTYLSADVA